MLTRTIQRFHAENLHGTTTDSLFTKQATEAERVVLNTQGLACIDCS
jgi:hypothetical protein